MSKDLEARTFLSECLEIPLEELRDEIVIDPEQSEHIVTLSAMRSLRTIRVADINHVTVGELRRKMSQ